MNDIPLTLTCNYCLYERVETLQAALAGKLDPPLWCPSCGRDLQPNWDAILLKARQVGLLPPDE
jgi:hypothetical protein